ncbi:MAG TPA: GNAT family N-acetyltransferase [Terriglobales bacterium]|nr:GNAT family N-acetyltransferase [Terriglobales bacterium]
MLDIRDATEADLAAILEITNEAIAHTTAIWSLTPATLQSRRAWFEDRRTRGFPVLVAAAGDAVLGFGSFGDFRPWEGYLHTVEHSVYVRPEAQGRGIGKLLLAELVARAAALGKHAMVAGIEGENAVSLALHRRAGFEESGRLRQVGRKFDRWLDLVFMELLLSSAAAGH